MLQFAIRFIDLTPIFFVIGWLLLAGWSLSLIVILSGREKHDMQNMKDKIIKGEEVPFLLLLKRTGYSMCILAVIVYVLSVFVD